MFKLDGIYSRKKTAPVVIRLSNKSIFITATLVIIPLLSLGTLFTYLYSWMSPITPTITSSIIEKSSGASLYANTSQAADTIAPDKPVTLTIPDININTNIQEVGLTKRGAMAVPNNTDEVGWFYPGTIPGKVGNAVITGHYDNMWMQPAIFSRINELQVGSKIVVVDEDGKDWIFSVTKISNYPVKEVPLEQVFGNSKFPQLNLITCSGNWSWKVGNYNERTVVWSELINQP